jgi:subtilisin family serine protease
VIHDLSVAVRSISVWLVKAPRRLRFGGIVLGLLLPGFYLMLSEQTPKLGAFAMVGKSNGSVGTYSRGPGRTSTALLLNSSNGVTAEPFVMKQLPYAIISDQALGLPPDLLTNYPRQIIPREIPGRQIPEMVPFADLSSSELSNRIVPLPKANTLAHINFQNRRFGRLLAGPGDVRFFNPETILVKLRSQPQVGALRVEPMREWDSVEALSRRPDVAFAELDVFQRRQFLPNDPLISNQWHHSVIGSFQAWAYNLGNQNVSVAIVDTPFQMNHPDLAANTANGWDAVANVPVNSSPGIVHSTMCAGMAAAVINNGVGVAGVSNCKILPININGAISEMYNAAIWAADNGVRVVNISWSGANDPTLEAAGYYLKTNTAGILVMSAIDGAGFLNWTNQPDIYCISTTDSADNIEGTMYGPYIDFAAPGWEIYSTTTGGGYDYGSGTSYAAPLFSGVAGWMLSINPALSPDGVIEILTNTAVDLGPPGWDEYFGWGRINFGAAAAATIATLPTISNIQIANNRATISANYYPGLNYVLWQTSQLAPANWSPVTNTISCTNANVIMFIAPLPATPESFYRIQAWGH